MESLLPRLEVGASREEAELTVILMHGLGADGHDFADVAEALSLAAKPRKWRFVLPDAPVQPVTINMGMSMPAWYDILDLTATREVNWETVEESARAIQNLMAHESAKELVLAGFSQGAAMALHVGLRNQDAIAGVFMMSGYLPVADAHPCPEKAADFPIGIFHGKDDTVVPVIAATQTVDVLEMAGYAPDLKIYDGLDHSVSEDELRDVFRWLDQLSPPPS